MHEGNRFENYAQAERQLWTLIVANSLGSGIHTFCTAIENADAAVQEFRKRFPPPQLTQIHSKATVAKEEQAIFIQTNALLCQ